MKKYIFLILIIFYSVCSWGQKTKEDILNNVLQEFKKIESSYVCDATSLKGKETSLKNHESIKSRIVNNATFDSLFLPIVAKVVVNNEELVKNGSAASLSFSEVTKKLSINYSWQRKKEFFWNVGFNAESGSDNIFEIYNKDGWNQGLGISMGGTVPVFKKTLIFLPSDCDTLQFKRRLHFPVLYSKYDKLLSDTAGLFKKIRIYRSINPLKDDTATIRKALLLSFNSESDFKQALADSIQIRNLYIKADTVLSLDISDFERKNLARFGYTVKWVNFGVALNFKTFNIYDTAVRTLAMVEQRDAWRFRFFGNLNALRKGAKNYMLYGSAGLSIGNTNFLEEMLPDDINLLKQSDPASGSDILKSYQALVLKDYESIKKDYYYINPSLSGNWFFGHNRRFGLELQTESKFKILVPENIDARHTFTVKGGFLFSFFGKDQLTKTTFGLIASFNEIPFNDIKSKDRFIVGIRIGVPFEML